MRTVITKSYGALPISEKEVLRYAGAKNADPQLEELIKSVIKEASTLISNKVCYTEADLTVSNGVCDFGYFKIESKDLSKNLADCTRAVIFAATVGIGIDRLMRKYASISPTRALIIQAFGAERIEALCDAFCHDLKEVYPDGTKNRYSVGYGDTPLTSQKEIFNILDAPRKIGLTLGESMLMSPTKSVTAFIGIKK